MKTEQKIRIGILVICVLVLGILKIQAQVKIHAHNDYETLNPFTDAIRAKAYTIEADVFPVNGLLCVAHHPQSIDTGKTLDKLYLQPFLNYYLTNTSEYYPALMIDIKNNQQQVLTLLKAKLAVFEEELKRNGKTRMPLFIISGERPPLSAYPSFPDYIQFDGRPSETYTPEVLEKVAFISDYFVKYSKWEGKGRLSATDKATIKKVADGVHQQGKLLRFWKIPDHPKGWKRLKKLGVDIINTDHPLQCTKTFNKRA